MGSHVIRDEEREKSGVVQFEPQKIGSVLHQSAKDFIQRQGVSGGGSSFHLSRPTAVHTGISNLEEVDLEKVVESRVMEGLKEVQEAAYKEAYELGLQEGRADARRDAEASIRAEIETLKAATQTLANMFQKSLEKNESSIVDLVFFLAEKIAFTQIEKNPDTVITVLNEFRNSEDFQGQIALFVGPADNARLQKSLADMGESENFLKLARIVEMPDLAPGGFLVETQYGQIDATVETRIKKVRQLLEEKKPIPSGDEP